MAFAVKFLRATESTIESVIKTYLDAQSVTTMHSINTLQYGKQLYTIIVFE